MNFQTGLFSDSSINPDAADGLFYDPEGGIQFLGKQFVAAVFAAVWSLGISYLLLVLVNLVVPVRATAEEQLEIDSIELGEAAYLVNETAGEPVDFKLLPISHWEVWNVAENSV